MIDVCIIVWVMQVSNNVIVCYVFYVNNYAIVNSYSIVMFSWNLLLS